MNPLEQQTGTIQGTLYKYHYIDHGAQFRVYAILTADGEKTGRVIKVPLDFEESKRVLEPHLIALGKPEEEINRRVHAALHHKQQLPALLQGMFAEDQHLMNLLGNLKLIPILAKPNAPEPGYFMPLYFTQDHVIPMGEYMHPFRFAKEPPYRITMNDTKRIIQLFHDIIQLHYHLWEYGIFDLTFKLENIGVVPKKRTVKAILVDGAEHTFDPVVAEMVLRKQKWRHPVTPIKTDHLYLPTILHNEYTALFERSLTIEAFRKHWKKRSDTIERRAINRLKIRERLARSSEKELALWMKRQTINADLRGGIPKERVDNMVIPHSDLMLLLNDSRVGKMPVSAMREQEDAERLAAQNNIGGWIEVYRHSFPAMP